MPNLKIAAEKKSAAKKAAINRSASPRKIHAEMQRPIWNAVSSKTKEGWQFGQHNNLRRSKEHEA